MEIGLHEQVFFFLFIVVHVMLYNLFFECKEMNNWIS